MLGVIPAAGAGTRMRPLAFSKELLPVGTRIDHGVERPRAVSEYLVERLIAGGADRLCFVIGPNKSDILSYYGGKIDGVPVCYAVQHEPAGLVDAIFSALPFACRDESVCVGLPDTVWFPAAALRALPDGGLSFLLFPVEHPELFDSVSTDERGCVREIQVKDHRARSNWVWGAFRADPSALSRLHATWLAQDRADEYLGTLVNRYLEEGGVATAVRAGESYVDVGTVHGYREALALLQGVPVSERMRTLT